MGKVRTLFLLAVVVCLFGVTGQVGSASGNEKCTLSIYVVWKQPHTPVPEDQYEIVVTPQPDGDIQKETVGDAGFLQIPVQTGGIEAFVITITHVPTGATGSQTIACPKAGSSEQIPVYIE